MAGNNPRSQRQSLSTRSGKDVTYASVEHMRRSQASTRSEIVPETVLRITSCDEKRDVNHRLHNTFLYELAKRTEPSHLVVRRGQIIYFGLKFNRPVDPEKDSLSIIVKYIDCKNPMVGQCTYSQIPIRLENAKLMKLGSWDAWVNGKLGKEMELRVLPPADCIIGRWSIDIDTKVRFQSDRSTYHFPYLLYMIFNPYCPDDEVYVDSKYLDEYLLTDIGLIYKGSRSPKPTHWVYGQFAKDVIDCCFYLVNNRAKISVGMRSDPVAVTRGLTAVIHSEYQPGVLMGNWSGDYSDGVRPQLWSGSAPILQKFYESPEPVKYGQCWVYAGVMTTVCRCLGIASRAVTCYSCGFGPDDTVSIDAHYFDNPEMAGKKNHRAFWNYHVWTECWMKRSDIGKGEYDGWQVLDASPQFPTSGIICLGPASVNAIKRGMFRTPYDTGFVYHEVNGDIHYWKPGTKKAAKKLVGTNKRSVGWFIGTKGRGSWAIEDVTNLYKHSFETAEEREHKFKQLVAAQQVDNTRYTRNQEFMDVEFTFSVDREVDVGLPIYAELKMKNNHIWKTYLVQAKLAVFPVTHTGETKQILRFEKFEIPIAAKGESTVNITVPYDVYGTAIQADGLFNCACQARIPEVDFDFYDEENIQIVQPTFEIEVPVAIVNEPVTGVAEFLNPLNIPLTNGLIYIQGHFFKEVQKINIGLVPPKQKITITFQLTALTAGEFSIAAKFISDQLEEVEGFARVIARNRRNSEVSVPKIR
ncbi:annulin-like [Cimex lectularius]|uniref:Transglutaminase-like domain-containing protein n=1 Tax=Cimex lectularius TaxID=79782 RepID=A0A8I6RC50_CIMLE|nr:annulin-like [Cimex lectularius]XP_014243109.1 annulin-like [Cimex lectularius]XP_014243119.1 annulin-like [Cimex lectularius]XP_014243127.1 annulin-like [Cimex lectularius]XP_014243136.1 annulin-like [Cimex lectularius]XP_014243145.1 annulin-like [Cimex lectularius]XP_014243153.1 annulin-like [Cimex lectularius]